MFTFDFCSMLLAGFKVTALLVSIALLEGAGFKATIINLTDSGIHSFDTNSIANLS